MSRQPSSAQHGCLSAVAVSLASSASNPGWAGCDAVLRARLRFHPDRGRLTGLLRLQRPFSRGGYDAFPKVRPAAGLDSCQLFGSEMIFSGGDIRSPGAISNCSHSAAASSVTSAPGPACSRSPCRSFSVQSDARGWPPSPRSRGRRCGPRKRARSMREHGQDGAVADAAGEFEHPTALSRAASAG